MQGRVLEGHGQAQDAHVSFEAAAERIDEQLRRYMRRLKDKSSPSQPSATLDEIQANASYIVFDAGAEEEEAGGATAGHSQHRVDACRARDRAAGVVVDPAATQPRSVPSIKTREDTPKLDENVSAERRAAQTDKER